MARRIHHVINSVKEEWDFDAHEGARLVRREAAQPSGADRIIHSGATYEARNGTFEVPDDVAAFMLRMPGWHEGESPFAEKDAADSRPKVRRTA